MSIIGTKLSGGRKFPFRDVTICLDGGLNLQRDAAMAELAQAATAKGDARLRNPRVSAARARIAEIEKAMVDETITIRITGVDFHQYNEWMKANPPQKGQQSAFNPETFFLYVARRAGKAVARYLDEERKTAELEEIEPAEWDLLEGALTDAEHDRIADAVLTVNRVDGAKGIDFLSSNSPRTTVSGETSASPATTE